MAKKSDKPEAAENEAGGAKVVIYSRIEPGTIKALDEIREGMKPTPTRAQMIDLAVAEYVERYGKRKSAK